MGEPIYLLTAQKGQKDIEGMPDSYSETIRFQTMNPDGNTESDGSRARTNKNPNGTVMTVRPIVITVLPVTKTDKTAAVVVVVVVEEQCGAEGVGTVEGVVEEEELEEYLNNSSGMDREGPTLRNSNDLRNDLVRKGFLNTEMRVWIDIKNSHSTSHHHRRTSIVSNMINTAMKTIDRSKIVAQTRTMRKEGHWSDEITTVLRSPFKRPDQIDSTVMRAAAQTASRELPIEMHTQWIGKTVVQNFLHPLRRRHHHLRHHRRRCLLGGNPESGKIETIDGTANHLGMDGPLPVKMMINKHQGTK